MAGETWQIGDVTVTRIVEIEATGGLKFLLPQATPEALEPYDWLKPHFVSEDGRLKASVHALVVQTPDRLMVVDTCIGNDKKRALPAWNELQTGFLNDMEAAGFAPGAVDTVMCTHLHIDHVGWNTMLVDGQWVPTFPKARYLMGETEFGFWKETDDGEQAQVFADSVRPVFDAGLVDLVSTDHQVTDEIRFVPTLGHTPGHVSVLISSRGEKALITGDFAHHPCQMARPDWSATVDTDPDRARATRLEMFDDLAESETLIIGTHFAAPTAGYLKRDGETYRLQV